VADGVPASNILVQFGGLTARVESSSCFHHRFTGSLVISSSSREKHFRHEPTTHVAAVPSPLSSSRLAQGVRSLRCGGVGYALLEFQAEESEMRPQISVGSRNANMLTRNNCCVRHRRTRPRRDEFQTYQFPPPTCAQYW
jgi:hypothetical protein